MPQCTKQSAHASMHKTKCTFLNAHLTVHFLQYITTDHFPRCTSNSALLTVHSVYLQSIFHAAHPLRVITSPPPSPPPASPPPPPSLPPPPPPPPPQ